MTDIYYTDMEGKRWKLIAPLQSPIPNFVMAIREDGQVVQIEISRLETKNP